jgi:adhesin/invasin
LFLFLALSVFPPRLFAQEEQTLQEMADEQKAAADAAAQRQPVMASDQPTTWNVPEWVKRFNMGFSIETDQKPRFYMETVQPLYRSEDKSSTWFTHDRISLQDERGTYSAGFGFRRLMFNDNILAGINNFFDYQDLHKHYRTGLGLEALSRIAEFRVNSYFGLSGKRLVESTGTYDAYERAATGGDMEIGAPLPYLPWCKMFGGFYYYQMKTVDDDAVGWKIRTEIKPVRCLVMNLVTYDDNKGDQEFRMDLRCNLAFDTLTLGSILSAFKPTEESFPDYDMRTRMLDRVERDFNIYLEKWRKTTGGGFIVEVRRDG